MAPNGTYHLAKHPSPSANSLSFLLMSGSEVLASLRSKKGFKFLEVFGLSIKSLRKWTKVYKTGPKGTSRFKSELKWAKADQTMSKWTKLD